MSRRPPSRILLLSMLAFAGPALAGPPSAKPSKPPDAFRRTGAPSGDESDFSRSLDFYNRRVREGASPEERLFILEKMEKRYAGRAEDLPILRAEKDRLLGDARAQIERSLAFYRRRVEEGAGPEERLFLLAKIEARHPGARADELAEVRLERKRLDDWRKQEELRPRFLAQWSEYEKRSRIWGDEEERQALLNQWEAEYAALPEALDAIRKERRVIWGIETARPPPRKLVKGFVRVDTWFKEEVYQQDHRDAQAALPGYLAIGYDNATASMKETGGFGARGGVFWLSRHRPVAMGGSVGYVLGPEEDVVLNAVSGLAEDGRQQKLVETDFLRVLFEAQTRTPLTRRTELRIGGGVGLAKARIRHHTGNAGSFVSALQYPVRQSNTKEWDGMTWEVSPAWAFVGEAMRMELGLSYAVFPATEADDNFDAFEWSPLGAHITFEF